jgi:DNA-binding response OmpR family regulator
MARIFLVDDDQNMAYTTKTILVREGYDVVVFYEARKALEEAKKQKPDLMLMDMVMPQFSGAEAIKELKKDADLAQIPIIILTGLISPEEYWDMTRMAVDGKTYKTLCKPYEIEELIKAVKESLRWTR